MRITPCAILLPACALLVAGLVFADPAAWYKWTSHLNGTVVCAQSSPGEGWSRQPKAFQDARCTKIKPA